MSRITQPLDTLVTSRICHDLAGAMGAVTNSFELMQMTGQIIPGTEEFNLIDESLTLLTQRLQLFRMAFGPAVSDQFVSMNDLKDVLKTQLNENTALTMPETGNVTRTQAKCLTLSVMCLARNLLSGRDLEMQQVGDAWHITLSGPVTLLPDWEMLTNGTEPAGAPGMTEANLCEFSVLARSIREGLTQFQLSNTPQELRLVLS